MDMEGERRMTPDHSTDKATRRAHRLSGRDQVRVEDVNERPNDRFSIFGLLCIVCIFHFCQAFLQKPRMAEESERMEESLPIRPEKIIRPLSTKIRTLVGRYSELKTRIFLSYSLDDDPEPSSQNLQGESFFIAHMFKPKHILFMAGTSAMKRRTPGANAIGRTLKNMKIPICHWLYVQISFSFPRSLPESCLERGEYLLGLFLILPCLFDPFFFPLLSFSCLSLELFCFFLFSRCFLLLLPSCCFFRCFFCVISTDRRLDAGGDDPQLCL